MPSFQYPCIQTTKFPQVHAKREDLPIQLPTLWSILSHMGVYTTLKSALAILREKGVKLIAYMVNLLPLAKSKDLILDQVTGMRYII